MSAKQPDSQHKHQNWKKLEKDLPEIGQDEAVGDLHDTGAMSIIMATPESTEDVEIEKYKRKLLKRF
ncbi:hypothetical protein Tco_1518898 [Tanacetum coccineum]